MRFSPCGPSPRGGLLAGRRGRGMSAPVQILVAVGALAAALLVLTHLRLVGTLQWSQHLPGVEQGMVERYVADERLLRALTEECAKGQHTVIYVEAGRMVVEQETNLGQCPLLDIMLRGQERGVGTCTDVALYVMHAGGRIIPMPKDLDKYDAACGARTARMLLETMYSEFVSKSPQVLYLHLLNSEHMWQVDEAMHSKVDVFLCKTRFCATLLRAHIAKKRWRSSVRLMGHSSSDPLVDLPFDMRRPSSVRSGFLHVKGKSGLKHTRQLLECWAGHREFPTLHVVGRFTWDEVEAVANAPNVRIYPKVTAADQKNQTEHISFQDIRNLQAHMPIHLCTSEREGFGHYINEARASGAAVISTNHPPMNELITPRSGLLIDPERTASYKEQSLGEHADINAFLSPAQICSAVSKALHWTPLDLESKGLAARSDYLKEKDEFYGRAAGLKAMLTRRRQAAEEGQLESFNLSDGVQGRGREGQGSEDGSSTNERVGQQVQAQQRAKKNQHE